MKRLEDKPPCSSWKNKEPVGYSENDREINPSPSSEELYSSGMGGEHGVKKF
jgi:hypothetical protein